MTDDPDRPKPPDRGSTKRDAAMTIDEAVAIAKRFRDEIPKQDWEATLRADPELRAQLQAVVDTFFELMESNMYILDRLLKRLDG
jgi:hypothetical protein